MTETEWYPTIDLKFPDGRTLTGDFDTGAPITFISYEWLVENGVISSAPSFGLAMVAPRGQYRFVPVKLTASLISGDSGTPEATFSAQAVRDWVHSPFFRRDRKRVALIGRDILKAFGATVELRGDTGETRVLSQNWSSFEDEVAKLYRALGLGVKKNYNLKGNQIDVFLTEMTASGKKIHTIVECKFHSRPVGTQYVRQLASILEFARSQRLADHGVLVSSSGFSLDAHLVAEATDIELLLIDDLRSKASQQPPETFSSQDSDDQRSSTMEADAEGDAEEHQRTAFVIMPFDDRFRDLYMLGIRETLSGHNFVCRRADELEFSGRIMDQILELIRSSSLIIAEVSAHNPNVYYELGISHAMEKSVVLCTNNPADIPFDTRDLNHIVYSDIVDLKEKLSRRIETLVIPE